MAEYHSISDLVKLSIDNNQEIWQVVLTGQAQDKMMSERDVFAQMKQMYRAMKSADELYDWQLKSPSGMAGGDGYRMRQYNESGNNICGDFIGMVMEKALKMGESNACMKRIVAACMHWIRPMHEKNCCCAYRGVVWCYTSRVVVL